MGDDSTCFINDRVSKRQRILYYDSTITNIQQTDEQNEDIAKISEMFHLDFSEAKKGFKKAGGNLQKAVEIFLEKSDKQITPTKMKIPAWLRSIHPNGLDTYDNTTRMNLFGINGHHRSVRNNLFVARSNLIKEMGIFTSEPIKQNDFIGFYSDIFITSTLYVQIAKCHIVQKFSQLVDTPKVTPKHCGLAVRKTLKNELRKKNPSSFMCFANEAPYLNTHGMQPENNMFMKLHQDPYTKQFCTILVAARNIMKGEELFHHYGKDYIREWHDASKFPPHKYSPHGNRSIAPHTNIAYNVPYEPEYYTSESDRINTVHELKKKMLNVYETDLSNMCNYTWVQTGKNEFKRVEYEIPEDVESDDETWEPSCDM